MSTQKNKRLILLVVAVVVVLCLALILIFRSSQTSSSPLSSNPVGTEESQTPTDEGTNAKGFPYSTDDGAFALQSLFLSSVFNSDGNGELAENVASISYQNTSGKFIRNAHLQVTLDSGDQLQFQLTDIPVGSSGIAFETSSASCNEQAGIQAVSSQIEYEDQDNLLNDAITCTTSGIEITVNNVSGADLSQIRIVCHCTLDGTLFGGNVFEYSIDSLPAGESTVVTATDCIYGDALVVRTTVEN